MSQQEHRRSSQLSNSLSSSNGQLRADEPDPEVVVLRRRRFTAAYKQRILAEAEACTERGELGALLRREGLYSSHLTRWREQRRAGQLEPQKRGRKANSRAAEVARLQRENERLKAQLERAELVIDTQKKLCQLFNLPSEPEDESE